MREELIDCLAQGVLEHGALEHLEHAARHQQAVNLRSVELHTAREIARGDLDDHAAETIGVRHALDVDLTLELAEITTHRALRHVQALTDLDQREPFRMALEHVAQLREASILGVCPRRPAQLCHGEGCILTSFC